MYLNGEVFKEAHQCILSCKKGIMYVYNITAAANIIANSEHCSLKMTKQPRANRYLTIDFLFSTRSDHQPLLMRL